MKANREAVLDLYYGKNKALSVDYYEISMTQTYLNEDLNGYAYFDIFFRKNPFEGGYTIFYGVERIKDLIENIKFTDAYIENLMYHHPELNEKMAEFLRNFKFSGDIYCVPDGTVVFPGEPIATVRARICEASLLETASLNTVGHPSLVATKASRVCYAAQGDPVMEFGLRRAASDESGFFGAIAAVMGGCIGTSFEAAAHAMGKPGIGTMAHAFVLRFDSEYEAFQIYARNNPENVILLVDTYDILKSGVPNAIRVFQEMKEKNIPLKKYGIRIDSGDLAYYSIEARKMLDAAGFHDATICASSDLDEKIIASLKQQGCKVDTWGVGTKLITADGSPSLGVVYKLAAIEEKGKIIPKIKISNTKEKITNPGYKKVVRFMDKKTGKWKADVIALHEEKFAEDQDITIFDPINTYKKTVLKAGQYTIMDNIQVPIYLKGKCVYESPEFDQVKKYCQEQLQGLWDEMRRLENPQEYYVDLSEKLWNLKNKMIEENTSI